MEKACEQGCSGAAQRWEMAKKVSDVDSVSVSMEAGEKSSQACVASMTTAGLGARQCSSVSVRRIASLPSTVEPNRQV